MLGEAVPGDVVECPIPSTDRVARECDCRADPVSDGAVPPAECAIDVTDDIDIPWEVEESVSREVVGAFDECCGVA